MSAKKINHEFRGDAAAINATRASCVYIYSKNKSHLDLFIRDAHFSQCAILSILFVCLYKDLPYTIALDFAIGAIHTKSMAAAKKISNEKFIFSCVCVCTLSIAIKT